MPDLVTNMALDDREFSRRLDEAGKKGASFGSKLARGFLQAYVAGEGMRKMIAGAAKSVADYAEINSDAARGLDQFRAAQAGWYQSLGRDLSLLFASSSGVSRFTTGLVREFTQLREDLTDLVANIFGGDADGGNAQAVTAAQKLQELADARAKAMRQIFELQNSAAEAAARARGDEEESLRLAQRRQQLEIQQLQSSLPASLRRDDLTQAALQDLKVQQEKAAFAERERLEQRQADKRRDLDRAAMRAAREFDDELVSMFDERARLEEEAAQRRADALRAGGDESGADAILSGLERQRTIRGIMASTALSDAEKQAMIAAANADFDAMGVKRTAARFGNRSAEAGLGASLSARVLGSSSGDPATQAAQGTLTENRKQTKLLGAIEKKVGGAILS